MRQKVGTDGSLFRMDTVNYDASGNVLPHLSRTYLTNQDGDWELSDWAGSEDVAYRLTGPTDDTTPAKMYNAYLTESRKGMDPANHYSESAGTYDNQAVEIVTVLSPGGDVPDAIEERFALNPATGALVSWSMTGGDYETKFETDVDLPAADFTVPSDKISTDTPNPDHDRSVLFDPTELKPTPTIPQIP